MFDIFVNFLFQFGRNYQLSREHIHFYRPQTKYWSWVMASQVFVYPQGDHCSGGISVQGDSVQDDFCPGVSVQYGFLSRDLSVEGVSLWGFFFQEGLYLGVSFKGMGVSVEGGLCPGVSLSERLSYGR